VFMPESISHSAQTPSAAATVFAAELACLMCSRTLGTAIDTHWPPNQAVLIRLEGSSAFKRVPLQQLRCPDCGGNTAPTEVTTRTLRRERPVDWQDERPHRGRPPKWLVAQRLAARMNSGLSHDVA
jgi:hypothetical protein